MKTKNTLCLGVFCLFFFPVLLAIPYRSAGSGDWSDPGIWETFNGAWGIAAAPPGASDDVTIRAGHVIDILLVDAAAGFLEVEVGATLRLQGTARALTIHNGNPAADFIVEGFFHDNASSGAGNGLFFSGGAAWRLGPGATLLKTNNSSAVRYRDHYHNGMDNIPASAQWIIRYVGLGHPAFSTIATYYPNLTFESTAGPWAPLTGFSQFTGFTGTATIKGNLDVGGAGPDPVTIVNENYHTDPIAVQGDLRVRSGSTLTNQGDFNGTGFRVSGAVVVDGELDLGGAGGRLVLGGNAAQSVAGSGIYTLQDVAIDNPAGATLARLLTIGRDLIFSAGRVQVNSFDLTVLGGVTGYGPGRYVMTNGWGPGAGALVRPVGGSVVFPVGNSTFNPATVESYGGGPVRVRVEDQVLTEGTAGAPLTSMAVDRTWRVEGAGPGLFGLALQWNAGDQLPGFSPGMCYISQYSSGWQGGNMAPAQGADPYLRARSGLQGATVFAVAGNGALPVELVHFGARPTGEGVRLDWQTASELNNDYFVLERRPGPEHPYRAAAHIPGAGATSAAQSYSYLDRQVSPGRQYYRLRQVDYDGTEHLSPVVAVTVAPPAGQWTWEVFPNPVRSMLHLVAQQDVDEPVQLRLCDARGRSRQERTIPAGAGRISFDVSQLPPGPYWVVLQGQRRQYRRALVKVE